MFKAIGLKDFGTWCREGREMMVSDSLAMKFNKDGYLKIIEYHLTTPIGRWNIGETYKKLVAEKKALDMKVKAYEDYFKKEKQGDKK